VPSVVLTLHMRCRRQTFVAIPFPTRHAARGGVHLHTPHQATARCQGVDRG
jgi:hypothetical protein